MTHSHSDLILKRKNNIPNGVTIWEEKHLQFLRDNQDKTVEYKAKVLGCSRSVVSLKMKEIGLQKYNSLAEPGYNEVIKAPPVPDQSKPLVEMRVGGFYEITDKMGVINGACIDETKDLWIVDTGKYIECFRKMDCDVRVAAYL